MSQAENSAYQQVTKAAADKIASEIGSSSPDAARIIQKIFDRGVREQQSLDVIVGKSVEYLAIPTDNNLNDDNQATLDDDWLNMFSRLAGDATSDRMRDLWARVLAGEIRRPSSFTLSTLRFMSEMDAEIAEKFQKAVRIRTNEFDIINPDNVIGQDWLELHFLEEIGLLQGVSGGLAVKWEPENGIVCIRDDPYALIIESEEVVGYQNIHITRIGRQICSILPKEDETLALRHLAGVLVKQYGPIQLARVEPGNEGDEEITVRVIDVIS